MHRILGAGIVAAAALATVACSAPLPVQSGQPAGSSAAEPNVGTPVTSPAALAEGWEPATIAIAVDGEQLADDWLVGAGCARDGSSVVFDAANGGDLLRIEIDGEQLTTAVLAQDTVEYDLADATLSWQGTTAVVDAPGAGTTTQDPSDVPPNVDVRIEASCG